VRPRVLYGDGPRGNPGHATQSSLAAMTTTSIILVSGGIFAIYSVIRRIHEARKKRRQ
jgi:hypothetical protein